MRAPRVPCLLWGCLPVGNPPPLTYSTVRQRGSLKTVVSVCADSPACPSTRHPALHPWEGTRAQAPESRPVDGHHGFAFSLCPCLVCGDSRPLGHQCALDCFTHLVVGSLAWRWQCRTKITNGFIRVIAVEVSLGRFAGSSCPRVLWESPREHTICNLAFSRMV